MTLSCISDSLFLQTCSFPSRSPPCRSSAASSWKTLLAFILSTFLVLLLVVALSLFLLYSASAAAGTPPSVYASIYHNGWSSRLQPASLPTSGTPALDVRPHPASISPPPANALDKPRTFTATPLPKTRLDQFIQLNPNTVTLPLAALISTAASPRRIPPPHDPRIRHRPTQGSPILPAPPRHRPPRNRWPPATPRHRPKRRTSAQIRHNSPYVPPRSSPSNHRAAIAVKLFGAAPRTERMTLAASVRAWSIVICPGVPIGRHACLPVGSRATTQKLLTPVGVTRINAPSVLGPGMRAETSWPSAWQRPRRLVAWCGVPSNPLWLTARLTIVRWLTV